MRREIFLPSICKMVRLVIGDNLRDVRHVSLFREGIVWRGDDTTQVSCAVLKPWCPIHLLLQCGIGHGMHGKINTGGLFLNAQFPCHPVLYSKKDIEYHKRSRVQLRPNVRSCGLTMFPDAAQEVPRIEHRDMQRRMMAYRKCPAWLGRVLSIAMSGGLALSSLLHEMIATAAWSKY